MKKIPLLLLSVFSISALFSQTQETDTLAQSKIAKLDFLVGDWEGQGWMFAPDRQRYEFEQTEKIEFKLDGTAILIEGLGKTDGKIIHNALAIISYNKENDAYNFQSYLANGRKGSFKAELIDDKFYWYPGENMRYIIEINNKNQWHEIGEFNNQGNWFQFFEMTLSKK